jgi:hypothetical protein
MQQAGQGRCDTRHVIGRVVVSRSALDECYARILSAADAVRDTVPRVFLPDLPSFSCGASVSFSFSVSKRLARLRFHLILFFPAFRQLALTRPICR